MTQSHINKILLFIFIILLTSIKLHQTRRKVELSDGVSHNTTIKLFSVCLDARIENEQYLNDLSNKVWVFETMW